MSLTKMARSSAFVFQRAAQTLAGSRARMDESKGANTAWESTQTHSIHHPLLNRPKETGSKGPGKGK